MHDIKSKLMLIFDEFVHLFDLENLYNLHY